LSAVLLGAARGVPGFAEWYADHIYPIFPHTMGRMFSLLPFSLFEILLLSLGAGALILTCSALLALAGCPARRGGGLFFPALSVFGVLFLLFTLTCGLNYSRETFAARHGLTIQEASLPDLRSLYADLAMEAGAALLDMEDAEAAADAEQEARAAMRALSREYNLISYYPRPKPFVFSPAMSWCGISGIFSPFTLEANYNRDMPSFQLPCAMCHELTHLSGYMREDEAGFIGYLACRRSGDAAFRYSGAMFALGHVLNALRGAVDAEEYRALYARLPSAAAEDFRLAGEYWRRFDGRAEEIQTRVNDAYLKANAQESGVQSYSQVVDLLLADWRARNREGPQ
jgi:hypothetical protein